MLPLLVISLCDIRFIRDQTCEILAQITPSTGIPIDKRDIPISIDKIRYPEVPVTGSP